MGEELGLVTEIWGEKQCKKKKKKNETAFFPLYLLCLSYTSFVGDANSSLGKPSAKRGRKHC